MLTYGGDFLERITIITAAGLMQSFGASNPTADAVTHDFGGGCMTGIHGRYRINDAVTALGFYYT